MNYLRRPDHELLAILDATGQGEWVLKGPGVRVASLRGALDAFAHWRNQGTWIEAIELLPGPAITIDPAQAHRLLFAQSVTPSSSALRRLMA